MPLRAVVLPALYVGADSASNAGQRWFTWARAAQLVLSIFAAIAGLVVIKAGPYDLAGLGALAAFAGVLFVQFLLVQFRPERAWYDGRVAAESVKHLAWRYAMRAAPFDENAAADALFLSRVNDMLSMVRYLNIAAAGPDQITEWMRDARSTSLVDRKAVYTEGRIDDQHGWYSRRSAANRKAGWAWRVVLYGAGAFGAAAGLAKFTGAISVDLMGLAATMVTVVTAWAAIKQYDSLTLSYSLAAQELASAHSAVAAAANEEAWSTLVNDTEDAISREHRSWRASRTG